MEYYENVMYLREVKKVDEHTYVDVHGREYIKLDGKIIPKDEYLDFGPGFYL